MADNKLFVDLSDDTKQRLDRLSKATDRSATSITAEAWSFIWLNRNGRSLP